MVGATLSVPAYADESSATCERNPNGADSTHAIHICAATQTFEPHDASADGWVWIGQYWGTTATDCKITVRLELSASEDGGTWRLTGPPSSCNQALQQRNHSVDAKTVSTRTTANYAQAVVCVDLYFNHSEHSGWQRCHYDTWLRIH
jgi:hypothetical protein